jgi:PAS domain S-box-containing protein
VPRKNRVGNIESSLDDHPIRLEAALRAAEIGTWTWDIRADQVRGDSNLNAMFGLTHVDDAPRPIDEYLRTIHPEDRHRVTKAIADAIALDGDDQYEIEYRLIASGRERWVLARGAVERDLQGVALRLPGVVLDITKQKHLLFERQWLLDEQKRQSRIFDTALSAITDFAYIFDLNGRFLYVNKALLDLWGLTLDQAIGKNFFDLQYPDALATRLQQQIQQVIDTRQGLTDETPYTSPTGAGGFYEYIFSPVFAIDGSVEVVAGSTRDVTARKRAADELRRRTAQFETLLNEAPLGVFVVDAEFRIREANPTALSAFGDIPNMVGRDLEEVMHSLWHRSEAQELLSCFRRTLETGTPFTDGERIKERRDRLQTEYYEWQVSRTPLPDGSHGVVCYFRDIAPQVQARRRLENVDKQKNEFLAMLSHELRNPLAAVRNAGEFLSRTDQSTDAKTAIDVVKRQVAHLSRLVDDLLDVSRISQGRIDLKRTPTELSRVIAQAIEAVDPLLKEKRHNVTISSNCHSLRVSADAARLVQCVANILTNAAKYTDPGGEIHIHSQQDGAEALLVITDNGAGIGEDLLPHVFEMFVQSERTLDSARGGLGIGLAVVKRLIEMHDGRVCAASPGLGLGSSFEIRLPLIERMEEPEDARPSYKAPLRRVLILDDNIDAADALALLLQCDGHETESVYTAADALERISLFMPDVVILDIGLPVMDGYEVARRIRSLPRHNHVRLVALTGYSHSDARQGQEKSCFDVHLIKPVNYAALEKALAGPAAPL